MEQTLFLDNLKISSISSEAKRQLEEPLNNKEVLKTTVNMKSGKTAGPDGIPTDIYKAFKDKLSFPLIEMYEESLLEGCLAPSLRAALMTLIPKPHKPQDRWTGCLSLLLLLEG